jgi:pimeloyl-ACP methyl ester carboxylesterase
VTVRFFEYGRGEKLAYERVGNRGRAIVFLHGFGASRESWKDLRAHLDLKDQLFFVDLKGFGLSSKSRNGDYSPSAQAEAIARFIKRFRLRNVALVGHSYGGGVAILVSARPDMSMIKHLVLLDAAGYKQPLPFFVGVLRIPGLRRVILKRIPPRAQVQVTLRRLFYNRHAVTNERVQRYARYLRLRGADQVLVDTAREVAAFDSKTFMQTIRNISLPTLIVWGEEDPAISVRNAYRFRRDIADSLLVVLPQCGHVPHEERPLETARILRSFLHGE